MQNEKIYLNNTGIQIQDYQGDNPPVIFLHYGGGNLKTWRNAVPFFSNHYRAILIDLRGHGHSDRPKIGNNIDTMAEDVVAVMDYLKITTANIVGSSLGAEVGLSIAANHPERVNSLVCEGAFHSEYGPFSLWNGSESEFKEHVMETLRNLDDTPEEEFSSIDDLVDQIRTAYLKYNWWNDTVEAVTRYDALELPNGSFTYGWRKHSKRDYMQSYFICRFEDYYRRVLCPVLMVPGDREMKNKQFRALVEALRIISPKAEMVEVKGWIHPYGWLLDCESMCREILKFLGRVNS